MTRKRRNRRRLWTVVAIIVVIVLVGVFTGIRAISNLQSAAPSDECTVSLNGDSYSFGPTQSRNAALIAALSVKRRLPAHAATIALATAMQESKLRNLSYGHADSVGLFQQRPSQGWGTRDELQDPAYATSKFYDALVSVKNYQTIPVTKAAQKVQHSAYPEAYAKHEKSARALASALTGNSDAAIDCTMRQADDLTDTEKIAQLKHVKQDAGNELGATPVDDAVPDSDGHYTLKFRPTGDTAKARRKKRWNVASWAIAVAFNTHISEIQVSGYTWRRSDSTDGWVKKSGNGSGDESRGGSSSADETVITVG